MNIKKFRIRYLLITWIVIYILISLFKYIKIKQLIYDKYGVVSKTFSTKKYINESIIVDGAMLIIGFPVLLLTGGWSFTKWAYSDVKFDFSQKLTTYIELKPRFMQEKFSIEMRDGRIVSDNFYEILSTDQKFQHLYSEWVKKQVGIEDSDMELKFYGQQSNPKLEISFDSIEYLSDDYREVFENVKYLYCNGINVNNIYDLTEENSYNIAKELLDKYFDKIVELIGKPPFIFSIRIGLSNNEFSDSDLNIYYRYDYSGEKELEKKEW